MLDNPKKALIFTTYNKVIFLSFDTKLLHEKSFVGGCGHKYPVVVYIIAVIIERNRGLQEGKTTEKFLYKIISH